MRAVSAMTGRGALVAAATAAPCADGGRPAHRRRSGRVSDKVDTASCTAIADSDVPMAGAAGVSKPGRGGRVVLVAHGVSSRALKRGTSMSGVQSSGEADRRGSRSWVKVFPSIMSEETNRER